MKKLKCALIILSMALCSACSSRAPIDDRFVSETTDISETIAEKITTAETAQTTADTIENNDASDDIYDYDMTVLSDTMAYAQYIEIMMSPSDYVGKTIKAKGTFSSFPSDELDVTYYYIKKLDATLCCSQVYEFIWYENGENVPQERYPDEESETTICGTFSTYEELGATYYYIAADTVEHN